MLLHQGKKFRRRHLERNRDILISVHHNHVIFPVNGIQISPSVIGRHRHIFRQFKISPRQIRDLFVNLNALHRHVPEVGPALVRICTRPHAENQRIAVRRVILSRHQRRRHCIVIVHARQPFVLHQNGLYPEEHICRQNDIPVILFHLQVIINGLPFESQIIFPEREAVRCPEHTAQKKENRRCRALFQPALFAGKVEDAKS